ncbi:MAG: divergent polysaccharide deacetylase family protein, partial [Syntrophales bacterium LBB04]|nr:divergent polysaccharide deacetylase family protein [Syntrophales bacterium LBB04]
PAIDPGKGALFRSMYGQEIRQQLERDLGAVPYVIGVNNHMGSAFTEDEAKLYVVLQALQEKGLFFIDSRTTPNSRAYGLAKKTGIPFASRKLFLDNDKDEGAILKNLLGHLEKNNRDDMVIIGHPYPSTVKALQEAVPIIISRGIHIVPPSEMVRIIGNGTVTNKQE